MTKPNPNIKSQKGIPKPNKETKPNLPTEEDKLEVPIPPKEWDQKVDKITARMNNLEETYKKQAGHIRAITSLTESLNGQIKLINDKIKVLADTAGMKI